MLNWSKLLLFYLFPSIIVAQNFEECIDLDCLIENKISKITTTTKNKKGKVTAVSTTEFDATDSTYKYSEEFTRKKLQQFNQNEQYKLTGPVFQPSKRTDSLGRVTYIDYGSPYLNNVESIHYYDSSNLAKFKIIEYWDNQRNKMRGYMVEYYEYQYFIDGIPQIKDVYFDMMLEGSSKKLVKTRRTINDSGLLSSIILFNDKGQIEELIEYEYIFEKDN